MDSLQEEDIMIWMFFIYQSFSDSRKRTIKNNGIQIILFKRTIHVVENLSRGVAGFDVSYEKFKEISEKHEKMKITI